VYCEIADIRAEGIPDTEYGDSRVEARILDAMRLIDEFCGWWFEARTLEDGGVLGPMVCSGRGTKILHLRAPIISVSEVRLVDHTFDPVQTEVVAANSYLVHSSILAPDDRWNPKLERLSGYIWPKGSRNVQLDGSFGFQEMDPSDGSLGTPRAIKMACIELTIGTLADRGDEDEFADMQAGNVESVKRADREETFSPLGTGRSTTGLPSVDRKLLRYRRRRFGMGVV